MTVRELIASLEENLSEEEKDELEVYVETDPWLYHRVEKVGRQRWFGENPEPFIAIRAGEDKDFT